MLLIHLGYQLMLWGVVAGMIVLIGWSSALILLAGCMTMFQGALLISDARVAIVVPPWQQRIQNSCAGLVALLLTLLLGVPLAIVGGVAFSLLTSILAALGGIAPEAVFGESLLPMFIGGAGGGWLAGRAVHRLILQQRIPKSGWWPVASALLIGLIVSWMASFDLQM